MNLFEQSLNALKEGGELEVGGSKVNVTKTTHTDIINLLTKAGNDWQGIKTDINNLLKGNGASTAESINGKLVEMVSTFDQTTKMYETASADTVNKNMTVIYGCVVGYLLLIFFSWQVTNKYIIKPLYGLQKEAEKIATGDLSGNF